MFKLALKGVVARRLRTFLTVFSVLLGVAMITGSYIYGDTIKQAFHSIFKDASKGADLVVSGKQEEGSQFSTPPSFSEDLLTKIRTLPGVAKAEGQTSDFATIVGPDGKKIKNGFSPTIAISSMHPPFQAVKVVSGRQPIGFNEVALDADTAEKHHFRLGQSVRIATDKPLLSFKLVGTIRFSSSTKGGANFIAFSLPRAQQLFNKRGKLDFISVAAKPGTAKTRLLAEIKPLLPADVQIRTSAKQVADTNEQINQQLSFIIIGLLAFGYIAVIVGAFIIFNTFSVTVTQRRKEFALLRMLGARRLQIMRSVMSEALVIGIFASLLGIASGIFLAKGINALLLHFNVNLPTTDLVLLPRTIIVALIIGILVSLLSSFFPAYRATKVSPLEVMRDQADPRKIGRSKVVLGLAITLILVGLAALLSGFFSPGKTNHDRLILSLFGLLGLVAGCSLISARLVPTAARVIGLPVELSTRLVGRLARENAQRNPSRTAITAAALAIGLTIVLFVTVFAHSISISSDKTVDRVIASDFAIYSDQGGFGFIPAAVQQAVRNVNGVKVSSPVKLDQAKMAGAGKPLVNGIDLKTIGSVYHFFWVKGAATKLGDVGPGDILLEQTVANKGHFKVGNNVILKTPVGIKRSFTVRGIYDDRLGLQGVSIPLTTFDQIFNVKRLALVFVKLAPGYSAKQTEKLLKGAVLKYPDTVVRSQAQIKEETHKQVNSLLKLFYALLILSLVVALFGIINTLTLSIHERRHELGLLRAVGVSKSQIRRMVRYESVITSIIGGVLGIVIGSLLSYIVIRSIKSSGIDFSYPYVQVLALALLSMLVGVLAALLPGWRAARVNLLEAISEE